MSENSSKSMPPLSDETKESKEKIGKGVRTNANNSSGNPKSPKSVINHANPAESNSSGTPSIPFTQKIASHDGNDYKIPKKTQNLYSKHEDDVVALSPLWGFPATGGHGPFRGSQYGTPTADHPIQSLKSLTS